jgi:diguanylate cyclase (GGDEF)-like protein
MDFFRVNARANAAGRLALAGLCLVVLSLSGGAFSVAVTVNRAADDVASARTLDEVYQTARDEVAAEDFWVTEYLLQLIPDFEDLDAGELRRSHTRAASALTGALEPARRAGTSNDRALTGRVLARHARYVAAVGRVFDAVDAGDRRRALAMELDEIDPLFASIETSVEQAAVTHRRTVEQSVNRLARFGDRAFLGTVIAFPIGMLLLGVLAARVRRHRRNELARLKTAALTDDLTGLANNRAFQHGLQSECARHRRTGEPFSLVMLDLDELKHTNFTYGHPMGDMRLKTLAQRLDSTARESDGVFRVGGDEFAAILPGATAWQALGFVKRLQARLGDARATAGICELSDGLTLEELIDHADQALMEAKRSQRGSLIYTERLEPPDGRASGGALLVTA